MGNDALFGEDTFEQAESKLQKLAVETAIRKSAVNFADVDCIFAGDLLNQCIGSSFGLMDFKMPFCGLYGACSTMALSLINAAVHIEAGSAERAVAVTSSHFCSAERQYRFPLEYGSQRPPSAQWTVTGSGAVLLGNESGKIYINSAMIGKICDLGVKDANNMGAAMAPDDVKIRPYPWGVGVWDLDLFSVIIFDLAALKCSKGRKPFCAFCLAKTKII